MVTRTNFFLPLTLSLTVGVLLCLFALVFASTAQAQTKAQSKAYIKLDIDSSEVFFGDTVVVDMESTGLLDPIDLSPLLEQASLVRETTGTRIAVYSGKVTEIKIRRMDLLPNEPGLLVIGPLTAGEISSNSVHTRVLDLVRPEWQPQDEDLQITTRLTPESVRVNQQLQLHIELLHRYPITGESITLPELNGFSHRPLLSNRRTFKGENRKWYRTEWSYLLFPRESGTLDIGSIQWSGTVLKSRTERAQFSREVESIKLDVGVAADYQSDWWLPSDSVTVTEEWSEPPTSLRAGDELTRVITTEASAVLSGQIPTPVVLESRALKQTLIDTKRSEQLSDNGIVSKAVFTYRVKAQSPIPVFMDTVRLSWWNTKTDEAREAIIPARRINVGLPDRADLLSNIALQETGVTRIKHLLQATDWLRIGLYSLAALAIIFSLWKLVPGLLGRYRKRQQLNTCISELEKAARSNNEEEMYTLLERPHSKLILAGAESDLVRALETRLYSRTEVRAPQWMPMIKSIAHRAKKNSTRIKSNSRAALAEL